MDILRCPQCDRRLKAPPGVAGKELRCPFCATMVRVPGAAPATERRRPIPQKKSVDQQREAPLSRPTTMVNSEELIDMTAMVDIVFFLLIFFLVTSMAGVHSSAKMPRPEGHDDQGGAMAHGNDEAHNDPASIVVNINKDDTIEIDGVPYHDLADLVVRLRQMRNANGADATMLVLGHGDASHGVAVSVLDAGYEVGIDRLRMAVQGEADE